MDFERIYKNRESATRLARQIREKTMPHTYRIHGPRGSGKRTLAIEIAAALNCEGDGHTLPCGRCNTCRRIRAGQFTDLKFLTLSEGKATIGVEEVRTLREDMFLSATESDYKIYVFADADKLTPQAQNALLKVLEEPPERVLILLLSESPDRLLGTIKSRAPAIRMQRLSPEELDAYLKDNSMEATSLCRRDEGRYRELLYSADGVIGQALDLLDERKLKEIARVRECVSRVLAALPRTATYGTRYEAIASMPQKRVEFAETAELVLVALGDLLVLKYDEDAPLMYFTDRETATANAALMDAKRIVYCKDLFTEALDMASKNANMTTLCALLSGRLK